MKFSNLLNIRIIVKNLFSSLTNYPLPIANNIKSVSGSGGSYLSNEIFYRVSFLREQNSSGKLTGHIHVIVKLTLKGRK